MLTRYSYRDFITFQMGTGAAQWRS